jgi:uncharacterized cofD-like protein
MLKEDIVTIGNGTGQGVVLRALRKVTFLERVTSLVGVTDNGGHTGFIRQQLGIPAVGDIKTIISALSGENVWSQLIRHRFNAGELKGVSIGNLILAGLVDESKSLFHATRRLTNALDLAVKVMPISDTNGQIVAELDDNSSVTGEWEIIMRKNRDAKIVGVHHSPELEIHNEVLKAIERATYIIICPGTLWLGIGSILASPAIRDKISDSKATVIAIGNILTQPGVTDGMKMSDHKKTIERLMGREIDFYVQHDQGLPDDILAKYDEKGFKLVDLDMGKTEQGLIYGDFVSREFIRTVERVLYNADRGYPHALRHSPEMLSQVFMRVSESTVRTQIAGDPGTERYEIKDF